MRKTRTTAGAGGPDARRRSTAPAPIRDQEQKSVGNEARAQAPAERTVDETIALHRNEWILLNVMGFDQDSWLATGKLLGHSPRRGDISKALAKEPPRSKRGSDDPYEPCYVVKALPRFRGGPCQTW